MKLDGRIALVTGGASGIGRATVLRLAQAGAAGLAINYRTQREAAETLAAEVEALGAQALCVQADVRDDAAVRAMVSQTAERFGRLDVLVNNAGVTHWVSVTDLEALTDAMWDDILDVCLKAAYRTVRAAAPLLVEAGGAVVNVASISGILATPTSSSIAYGAAKAALIYLTRALAVSLGPKVRVNAIAPAFTDTRWMANHYGADYARVIEQASAAYPLERVGTPEDMANAIVSLVTGSDFVTGQTLVVDGGLSLS